MAVHNAATCSYADVMAAYALCVAGDTLGVPAGSATWATSPVFTRGIDVIGAGIGATVITHGAGVGDFLIVYRPTDANFPYNYPFRFSGFTIDLANRGYGLVLDHGHSSVLVPQTKIRIDHNRWQSTPATTGYQAIWNEGMRGVCDNNQFAASVQYPVRSPSGMNATWWNGWAQWGNMAYGASDNNMYFEDNDFESSQPVMDCQQGNRYVVRYNNISLYPSGTYVQAFDMHGNNPGGGGGPYSSMGGEIYGNLITAPPGCGGRLQDHRGGKQLIFMNTFVCSGGSNLDIQVRDEYPDSDNPVDPSNSEKQYPNDGYFFLNRLNYTDGDIQAYVGQTCDNPPLSATPQENREFFNPVAQFDGTHGVGYGPLSARPATCTVGVGYWATDQSTSDLHGMVGKGPASPIVGTLYKCVATNVWIPYFTPLPYPHPLRGQTPAPGDPAVLVLPNNAFELAASSITLVPTADYHLVVAAADFMHSCDSLVITPIEPTPWDIRLGLLGEEVVLPLLNWPAGSSPEMPAGETAYIDSVQLSDGSMQHNFRTYSPRKWAFEWARLSEAEVAVFNELAAHNEPLHFQNKWVNADWHWVIITACDPVPLTATFTTGTPFWKLTLELEEII